MAGNNNTRRGFLKTMGVGAALGAPFCATTLPETARQIQEAPFFNVRSYGATGDGRTLDTKALQQAIDACHEAGGGTVYVPHGTYLTTPLSLKDYVNVHLSPGATLLGSQDIDAYPSVEGRWEGIERTVYASLFTGHDLKNVSITGRGTLDGQGEVWWEAHEETERIREEKGITGRAPDNPPEAPLKWPRPRMINLYRCHNVLIQDITILNSPAWTVHPVYCENVTVDAISIIQPYTSPNTDGINPDSCRNVRISNCYVDVGDDCITLKSGYNEDGRRVGIPCENIVITNCTTAHGHGGVVVGSEMSGDVRNVAISNCVFDGTQRGLRLKTTRGRGGIVENIRASNLVMRGNDVAFAMTMFYQEDGPNEPHPVTEETPRFRNIHYDGITIESARSPATIRGLAEMPIEDLSLTNIRIGSSTGAIDIDTARDVVLSNIVVDAKGTPAVKASNVEHLDVDRLTDRHPSQDVPILQYDHVRGSLITGCTAAEGTGTFLELVGGENQDVKLVANRLSQAESEMEHR